MLTVKPIPIYRAVGNVNPLTFFAFLPTPAHRLRASSQSKKVQGETHIQAASNFFVSTFMVQLDELGSAEFGVRILPFISSATRRKQAPALRHGKIHKSLALPTDLWYNEAKKGGEPGMNFSHCDHNEQCLSLHDCIAERAYLENGKLGFEFEDGFWVSPDHPESPLTNLVRTDFSKVEYTLEDGGNYDVTVYVLKRSFGKKTVGTEWTVRELVSKINAGECKLEFLYQYLGYNTRMVECELICHKKPYRRGCIMKISAPEVSYYWNNLREDRPW